MIKTYENKDYYLVGDLCVISDFLYIFDQISVIGHGDLDRYFDEYYPGASIIICAFDNKLIMDQLDKKGLEYGSDYYLAEDFFILLDDFQISNDREIAVWGAGRMATKFLKECDVEVSVIINTYKNEDRFMGIRECMPDEIGDWRKYYVIVAVDKDREIIDRLKSEGMSEYIDYVSYQKYNGRPSKLLKKTIFDRNYYDLSCETMMNHLEVLESGKTRCCCTTFVAQDLDNVLDVSESELWASNTHKVMCLSCANHTYTFCDKDMCPLFVGQDKYDRSERRALPEYKKMTEHPRTLALGYDASCNLYCETCREKRYIATGNERKHISRITELINRKYLPYADFLILAGDGELFLSSEYRAIYTDPKCNPTYIRILSNGMIFNEKTWSEFVRGKKSKIMATFSIDAATKDTYEKIRRGGNFDIIRKNMEYASKLRKNGELAYLRLNFVVQRKNYMEMGLFARWGEELGVDEVFFTKILNWGTYTDLEFDEISMMESDGISPKPELQKVLEDETLLNSKIVDLGTIRYLHKKDFVEEVNNYYKWELEKRGGHLFD